EIDYLARGAGADVLRGEPVFGRVFRLPEKNEGRAAMWRLIRDLRGRRYAAAVDFYSNPRSALLVRLTGARMRIGGDRRVRRRLYTHPMTIPPGVRRATDHHLSYLRPLGVTAEPPGPVKPALRISDSERESAGAVLRSAGIDSARPTVGVHPGGKWMVKRWPTDKFAELIERLGSHGLQIVVLIGPGEEIYQSKLRGMVGDRAVYLPTLPIRETAAVIDSLDGMVVCDGGIMHISVAVDTPTVGIFGSAEPDIWFPYEDFGPFTPAFVDIECRPCHRHECDHISCLRGLNAETVEERLRGVMAARRSPEPL
ncbi:MAG: glycosyltransferase family 9 protein, partial [bacterium]